MTHGGHHCSLDVGSVRYLLTTHARPSVKLESFTCLAMPNLPTKFQSCQLIPSVCSYMCNYSFNLANSPKILSQYQNPTISKSLVSQSVKSESLHQNLRQSRLAGGHAFHLCVPARVSARGNGRSRAEMQGVFTFFCDVPLHVSHLPE